MIDSSSQILPLLYPSPNQGNDYTTNAYIMVIYIYCLNRIWTDIGYNISIILKKQLN